ncbi:MAG: helix-turn-helix domain-containing protein [Defluviitaleaceae bacterium]|nr:helix-turn-helix domain-containing protein [Defluviitaleaceae bacterium]
METNMMNMSDISMKISTLRKQRDMTQLELADKLNVSYQAVSSWERALTMPDISKLPDISQVLQVSIDELLGNDKNAVLIKNVLTGQTDTYMNENALTVETLTEVAPILKPSQVDNLAENLEPVSINELTMLAPFISQDALQKLAEKAENIGDFKSLSRLAPFLDSDYLDNLALKTELAEGIKALNCIAPFISKHVLQELAVKSINRGNIRDISSIAPFLGEDFLSQAILKMQHSH